MKSSCMLPIYSYLLTARVLLLCLSTTFVIQEGVDGEEVGIGWCVSGRVYTMCVTWGSVTFINSFV